MGIKDLYGVLKLRCPDELQIFHLSQFRGYKFAVDISIVVYKYIRSAGEGAWMNTFFLFLCTLKKHGIKTVCIFDGPNPPIEKKEEQERRRADGQKAIARMERCIEVRAILLEDYVPFDRPLPQSMQDECKILYGKPKKNVRNVVWEECTDALDAMKSTIDRLERQTMPITAAHRETAKQIVVMMGLPMFQADGEAEALCAYMAVHGHVDAILTEDTDVLAYGTPYMVAFKDFKLSDEKVYVIDLPSLRESLGYTQDEFRDLCILLECDYNHRVKGFPPDGRNRKKAVGIGLKGALCMIDEYRRLEEVVKHVTDPDPLIFRRCREIFTPPNNEEVVRLIKVVPNDIRPNFEVIRAFIAENRLSMSVDYIEKCWTPGKLNFHFGDDDSEQEDFPSIGDSEEEEELDILAAIKGNGFARQTQMKKEMKEIAGEYLDKLAEEEFNNPRYYVMFSVLCAANTDEGEDEVINLVCGFIDEEFFETYEDTGFDDLIEPINKWLAADEETSHLYVDDCIEVESVFASRPEGIRVLEVE